MSRVRVHNFTISLDGYGSGEHQTLDEPFGHAGHIMDWFKKTQVFHAMIGDPDKGETGIDNDFASAWGPGIGAEIMGRNKFAPKDGQWPDENWKGWWGSNPPFHTPCFVLTHHKREPLEMEGGNVFYFIDASPLEALEEAKKASGGLDVRIGGGASTLRDFLAAGLVDYLHVAIAPVLVGSGVKLFDGLEGLEQNYQVRSTASPSGVTHIEFERE